MEFTAVLIYFMVGLDYLDIYMYIYIFFGAYNSFEILNYASMINGPRVLV